MAQTDVKIVIGAVDKFSKTFKLVGKGLGYLTTGYTALNGAMLAIAKSTAASYDELGKFSDQTGMSTEFLSRMRVAAEYSGVAANTLDKSLQKLSINIAETADGTGMAVDAFKYLNINVKNADGSLKSASDIMPELADGLKNVEDSTKRTQLAYQIFGQRGLEMLQITKDGAAGMNALFKESDKLGMTMNKAATDSAAQFNDSMSRMNMSIKGVKNAIGVELMPSFTRGFNFIATVVSQNRDKIVSGIKSIMPSFDTMAKVTVYSVAIMKDAFVGLKVIWQTVNLAFSEFNALILRGFQKLVDGAGWVMGVLNKIPGVNLTPALEKVKGFSQEMEYMIGGIQLTADQQAQTLENTVSNTSSAIAQAQDQIKQFKTAMTELNTGLGVEGLGGGDVGESSDGMAQQTMLPPFDTASTNAALANAELLKSNTSDTYGTLFNMTLKGQKGIEKLKSDHAKRMNTVQANQYQTDLQNTHDFFKNMSAVGGKFGKAMFRVYQAQATAEAIISTYAGAARALKEYPYPISLAMAAGAVAFGLAQVARITGQSYPQAHAGLTNVPEDSTYMLRRGERVLAPAQNRDLTEFMNEKKPGPMAGITVDTLNFNILPNATNVDAMMSMSKDDWREIIEDKIYPAMDEIRFSGAY